MSSQEHKICDRCTDHLAHLIYLPRIICKKVTLLGDCPDPNCYFFGFIQRQGKTYDIPDDYFKQK